jgi:hypothetical protein
VGAGDAEDVELVDGVDVTGEVDVATDAGTLR